MRDATLILMTLNELPGLRATFAHIPRGLVRECFAVDGGSTDGTREYLLEQGVRVLDQARPGWGEAARVGVGASTMPRIVFFSPDGNQDPADIPLLLDRLEEGFDLAIASRFLPGSVNEEDGEFLRLRARGCRAFTALANRAFGRGQTVTDATNGFRAVTKSAWDRLELDTAGFELAYQMTIQALKAGLRFAEIPTFEGRRLVGPSKARTIPAGAEHLRTLLAELRRP